ncbi:MAG TPA: glycerophosphodiester phosphodiesterase family protein [Myxococcota bacterium]|nr:glycerophosphodiester phosphodiesterase family protein [Myxococcota bacterium]
MRATIYALVCIACAAAIRAHADERPLEERLQGQCVAAHRGGFRYDDSNTLSRFETARLEGADIVETDLRSSRDGVVFLFHDRDLRFATDCQGDFSSKLAREIERCRLRRLGVPPERFERALAWSRGRVVLDAELKARDVARPAIELVRRYGAYEWVYFQVRNDPEIYRTVRAYDRRVAVEAGPLGDHAERELRKLLALADPRLLVVQLHPEALTPEILEQLHAAGKRASIDAWRVRGERLWTMWLLPRHAGCEESWQRGADIAVTNVPGDCVDQRARLRH